jgi:hypothetical protein
VQRRIAMSTWTRPIWAVGEPAVTQRRFVIGSTIFGAVVGAAVLADNAGVLAGFVLGGLGVGLNAFVQYRIWGDRWEKR